MYVGSLPAHSNREDWRQAMTLVDADTGEDIDISLCTITMTLRDKSRQAVLTGSTDSGEITLVGPDDPGTFQWLFPETSMNALCQAQYDVGIRISQDDRVAQLVIATIDIFEGIDQQ